MREETAMCDELDAYQTYLLRLWRAQCKGRWQWRASIVDPRTGERHWFASLEQLFAYFGEQCNGLAPHAPEAPGSASYP